MMPRILNLRGKLSRRPIFVCLAAFFLILELNHNLVRASAAAAPEVRTSLASEQATFFVDKTYDFKGRSQVSATLYKSSQNANFYLEDDYWNSLNSQDQVILLSRVNVLGDDFDQKIYPRLREVYGSEWSYGIDNDPKINILLTQIIPEAGGYFNPNDEYPKSQIVEGRSNEREILYLNIAHLDDSRLKSFLAHEFQHMINWYQKTKLQGVEEDVWLNEALSEYAPTVAGFDLNYSGSNLESRINNFLKNPSDPLVEWGNTPEDYGSVNVFMQYLTDQYGTGVIKYIMTDPAKGITAVNDALKKAGYAVTFDDVFNNWVVANLLNNPYAAGDPKYAYKNPNLSYINLHVAPTVTYPLKYGIIANGTFTTEEWSPHWYEFTPINTLGAVKDSNSLKIDFSSSTQSARFAVPYVVYFSGGQAQIGFMSIDARQAGSLTISDFGNSVTSVVVIPVNEEILPGDITQNDAPIPFSINASMIQSDTPAINNITPVVGNIAGGMLATIKGANFKADSKIYFDGVEVASYRIVDPGTIELTVPAHAAGRVDIKVANTNMKNYTLPRAFTYFSLADGILMRAADDYRVYIVNGNYKRWIQAPEIFGFYQHFDWNKITIVSHEIRDAYQTVALVRAANDYKVYEINGDNTKHWVNISPAEFIVSGRRWDMVQIINSRERDFYKTGPDIK